jgi:anti-anti-sigma factor
LEPNRERVILRPIGEVDLATADEVEQPLVELLEEGFHHVVVDLRRVTFLDSSGIRVLVTGHRRAQELGARLSVKLGGAGSRLALETSGALDYLDVEWGSPAS